ncbi:hypothetical protein [Kitasatospora sp. P5_F3]
MSGAVSLTMALTYFAVWRNGIVFDLGAVAASVSLLASGAFNRVLTRPRDPGGVVYVQTDGSTVEVLVASAGRAKYDPPCWVYEREDFGESPVVDYSGNGVWIRTTARELPSEENSSVVVPTVPVGLEAEEAAHHLNDRMGALFERLGPPPDATPDDGTWGVDDPPPGAAPDEPQFDDSDLRERTVRW